MTDCTKLIPVFLYLKSLTEYVVFIFAMFLKTLYPELKVSLLIQYLCIDSLQKLFCLWPTVLFPCPDRGTSHSWYQPLYNVVHLLPVDLQLKKLIYKYGGNWHNLVIFREVRSDSVSSDYTDGKESGISMDIVSP